MCVAKRSNASTLPLTNASIAAFSRLSRCCVVFENGGLSPVYPPLFGRAPRFLGRGCPIFFATSKLTWNGAHVTHSSLPLPVVCMGTRTPTGGFFCVSSLFRWQLLLGNYFLARSSSTSHRCARSTGRRGRRLPAGLIWNGCPVIARSRRSFVALTCHGHTHMHTNMHMIVAKCMCMLSHVDRPSSHTSVLVAAR